jgi:hypothetical protein
MSVREQIAGEELLANKAGRSAGGNGKYGNLGWGNAVVLYRPLKFHGFAPLLN